MPFNITIFAQEILNNYIFTLEKKLNIKSDEIKPAIQQFKLLKKKCEVIFFKYKNRNLNCFLNFKIIIYLKNINNNKMIIIKIIIIK